MAIDRFLVLEYFMYKVTSKIRFDILLRGGGALMKNVAVTFYIPKLIDEWPLRKINIFVIVLQKKDVCMK